MKLLPHINPFPISQRPYSQRDIQIAEFNGEKLPMPLQATDPVDLVETLTNDIADNRLPNALHDFLGQSKEYNEWKKSMPFLKDVPNIHKYKNVHLNYDQVKVDGEIRSCGAFLPEGQVLYHGGTWPETDFLPNSGEQYELTRPFSTTLCPQVAAVHACHHKPKCIWVIKVESATRTPVFVFNNKAQNLSHETEVLFASGAIITCIATKASRNFYMIEVTIN